MLLPLSVWLCSGQQNNHCPFVFERTRSAEMFPLPLGLKEHLTVLGIQRNRNKSPSLQDLTQQVLWGARWDREGPRRSSEAWAWDDHRALH